MSPQEESQDPSSNQVVGGKQEEGLLAENNDHDTSHIPLPTSSGVNRNLPRQRRPSNPLQDASIWSKLTFAWAYAPLLAVGSKRPLEEMDLPELDPVDTSSYQRQRLQQIIIWSQNHHQRDDNNNDNNNDKGNQYSLGRTLLWDYFRSTGLAQGLLVIQMISRIGQAVALGYLLQTFEDDDDDNNVAEIQSKSSLLSSGYFWAGVLTICAALSFPAKQLQFFETYRKGMQTRVGLVAAIYEKTLRLPSGGGANVNDATKRQKDDESKTTKIKATASASQITNLASNDVERFLITSVSSIYLIYGPLEAIAIVITGMFIVGPSFAAGLIFLLIVLLPLQFYLSSKFVQLRSQVASKTDARLNWVSQAIAGARVVKLNGWEGQLEERIQSLRQDELDTIQISTRYKAFNEAVYFVASLAISVVIFLVDVFWAGNALTARKVFTTLSLNNILQMTLARLVPNAIVGLSECHVSCRRIQAFLQLPEQEDIQKQIKAKRGGELDGSTSHKTTISLTNVTSYWESSFNKGSPDNMEKSRVKAVKNITLQFRPGELYAIIGKVGSGKSALLLTLAGELNVEQGSIERHSASLSYVEQEPWIMNGTVRENIVMGEKFEQSWYDRILFSCGLEQDLQSFAAGDQTIVGDRGVQCSGGQKSRIALARALYKNSEVVLLDDPLSAVDAHVGQHIYHHAIRGICSQKCVILVTHQHRFIDSRTRCILMAEGRCQPMGLYEEVTAKEAKMAVESIFYESASNNSPSLSMDVDDGGTKSTSMEDQQVIGRSTEQIDKDAANVEKRTTGLISWSTWRGYSTALGGWPVAVAFFAMFSITQTALMLTIIEVGKWSEVRTEEQNSTGWLAVIVGLTLFTVLLSFLRASVSFFLLVRASKRLHRRLLKATIYAKIEFYDCNPIGRILNRFSADAGVCDEILPLTIFDFLVGFCMAIGSIVTALVVLPFVLIALPFLIWRFWKLRQVFVATTREVKRLEGISRSPIYALVSETVDGVGTLRSNGYLSFCREKFESSHDAHTRAFFSFVSASRWFAFRMDAIAFCILALSSIFAVVFHAEGLLSIDSSVLGLALTLLLQLAGTNFPWIIRQSAEIVNQAVSVERILEYASAPQEPPMVLPFDNDQKDWPVNPSISFENFSVRYRQNLPRVLTNISFDIGPSMKVGIVGRSGSGKSSTVQSLFRLLEADEGSITIDGVDISKFGLHKLRQSMSVIPQQPFLFSNSSIRENLDPFGQHDDATILKVLDSVQMKHAVRLDSVVGEGGTNFSVGQRQLLCLARTILRKKKILVLDEATANVDLETSKLIYDAVDHMFQDATVVCVAHRLEAVLHYDRILALGDGCVLEYGTPKDLLSKKGGFFASMVRAQGIKMD